MNPLIKVGEMSLRNVMEQEVKMVFRGILKSPINPFRFVFTLKDKSQSSNLDMTIREEVDHQTLGFWQSLESRNDAQYVLLKFDFPLLPNPINILTEVKDNSELLWERNLTADNWDLFLEAAPEAAFRKRLRKSKA
jgi:hypothetical protein